MTAENRYGLILGDVQYLSEAEIAEIASHIASIDSIWRRLSRVRADDWIDEDLVKKINHEVHKYAKERSWRVGARDLHGGFGAKPTWPSIISMLRGMAEGQQDKSR